MRSWVALLALWAGAAGAVPSSRLIDDFRDAGRWQASASDQVQVRVAGDGRGATCLHYDFGRVSGYAVARRTLALELPAHYAFTLRLRGNGPPNAFQLKLVDASGDNVWWRQWPDFSPPARATDLRIRQRQISFAWGPTEDKQLRRAAALELVVASGRGGGAGQLCFERLSLHTLDAPAPPSPPTLTHGPAGTTLSFGGGALQEFNGLLWRWDGPRRGPALVQASDDGRTWRTLHRLPPGQRSWQALWLPEQEARHIRITGATRALDLTAPSPADWPDRNALLAAQARQAPRSLHPRALHGEQNYWTVVGVDGGGASAALLSEDGAIEPQRGGPSLEPLVIDGQGRTLGWAEVQAAGGSRTTLRQGHLPLPTVHWSHPAFGLAVEAGADGHRSQAQLIARYTLHNPLPVPQQLTLLLALRPWQVNPPQQFLNTAGGVADVRQLAWQGRQLQVNGRPWLQALDAPAQVQAAAFDHADPLTTNAPALQRLHDPQGLASAVLRWPVQLAADERRTITIALPLAGTPGPPRDGADAAARLDAVAAQWQARLNKVQFQLPPQAQVVHDSLRAALAHILVSRDGPALQPGTRSYARTWVRDGAMMVAGLLRLGELDAARDFTTWYAGFLFANGKVPCCVDARGADPVAENDSHGQFIFSVAELWRHTGDRALAARLWPQVDAAARYMEQLRQSERIPANDPANPGPGRAGFWGTMPASISHEGYSAKPMHSHWDNFWALAGWRDAVLLARALGHGARAAELQAQHDEFRRELGQSLAATMAQHGIGHLPGAVELGDFDPTSSSMIFSPAGAEDLVPRAVLDFTWQRWWDEAQRRIGGTHWNEYTPYELRSVSALLRLGLPQRAHAMLDFFHADQRPAGWHQWGEVVDRQLRHPRFIGDMPHAWISSDYIRSALDLLAYERDSDGALVLGAGVLPAWLADGPVGVQGLRTPHGPLGYRLALRSDGAVHLQLSPGLAEPPGGLWLAWQGQLHRVPPGQLALLVPGATAPAASLPDPADTPRPGRQVAQQLALPGPVPTTVRYWLHLPPGYAAEPQRRWPVLFFLHGSGERGSDLAAVKVHGPPKFIAQRPDLPFIVVSPQVEAGGRWDPHLLHALLGQLKTQWRIDPDRVSATGLSMGGRGTWAWAAAYPGDLAAIAPVCGDGDPAAVGHLRQLPVWAFHGAQDTVVPIDLHRRTIDALRAAGGQPRFTVYPTTGHDAWTPAYAEPALFDWLLAQRRP